MLTTAAVRAAIAKNRVQAEAIGVGILALIVAIVLGVKARSALQPAKTELARLAAASSEIASFRSSFKTSTPEQDMRIAQLADSLGIGVERNDRVSVAQQIAAMAEDLGLNDVRVRFAPPDSATPPPSPEVSRVAITVADYSIAVECSGGLAALLSLINELPPSVALQRITGINVNGRTRFQLALAVFESSGPASGSPGSATHD
jgi:hypothetical protein